MASEPCRCDCGYRCGGPGTCDLDVLECLQKDDDNHYVRDCDHDFSGPLRPFGPNVSSTVCQKCGMSSFNHDFMVGP